MDTNGEIVTPHVTNPEFGSLWRVAADYVIADGLVVPRSGDRARVYAPADAPQLALDLAEIESGDQDAALDFERRWGALGFRDLTETTDDPLPWVFEHAKTLRLCVDLLELVGLEDWPQLNRRLTGLSAVPPKRPIGPGERPPLRYAVLGGNEDASFHGEDEMRVARAIVARIISDNIANLHWVLRSVGDRLALSIRFDALVEVAYWHIGRLAEARDGWRRCLGCGRRFVPTRGQQRYCDPLCGGRERTRKWRKKAK